MAITYADKVQNAINPLPVEEQWRAVDANEVKNEVNANITATGNAAAAAAAAQVTASAAQPGDTDLSDIAALTPSNDDFIQRKSGVWTNRTIAQVRTDILTSSWQSWTPTFTGFSVNPTGTFVYQIDTYRNILIISITGTNGTSNATGFTFTLPAGINAAAHVQSFVCQGFNSGAGIYAMAVTAASGNVVTMFTTANGALWTASGTKGVRINCQIISL